ncbi:MAG TPA: hypothetical protein VK864_04725, partial [Longimicrobiales bacterium]|nr:hypothetical protein [Longimicrobiales bacterium]
SRACARVTTTTRVKVMDPLLAERIERLAGQSPSFQQAWAMILNSGVPVQIGRFDQLRSELPRWYRSHPARWAGVTVNSAGATGDLDRSVVALHVELMERQARAQPIEGDPYFLAEVDRVLIHEIYGHLAPVVEAGDARKECPDHLRRGETRPCVTAREALIAAELAHSRLTASTGNIGWR